MQNRESRGKESGTGIKRYYVIYGRKLVLADNCPGKPDCVLLNLVVP